MRHIGILEMLICKGKILMLSILMANLVYVHFSMQEEEILENNVDVACHLYTL